MVDSADFKALADRAVAQSGRGHMRPVIEKELLHFDILFRLDQEGLLDALTFQGGTALRLCYGSPRFSEDLDFVGGVDFSGSQLEGLSQCLEHYIGRRYGLTVVVKEPAELRNEPAYRGLNVDKWQISVVTAPQRPDIPRQRIKIEVANIPAYSRVPRSLNANYEFLPDGYGDTLVLTESLDEILADKVVSLVNTQGYVRHRDIWDLRWLRQREAKLVPKWVNSKIRDYGVEGFEDKLDSMRERLPAIIHGEAFVSEMRRFLPMDVQERTLRKGKFLEFLASDIGELLDLVRAECEV